MQYYKMMMMLLVAILAILCLCAYFNNQKESFCSTLSTNDAKKFKTAHPYDPQIVYPEMQDVVKYVSETERKIAESWPNYTNMTTRPIFNLSKFNRIGLLYPVANPQNGYPLFGEKMGKGHHNYFYYDHVAKKYKQIQLPNVIYNGDEFAVPEQQGTHAVIIFDNDLPIKKNMV